MSDDGERYSVKIEVEVGDPGEFESAMESAVSELVGLPHPENFSVVVRPVYAKLEFGPRAVGGMTVRVVRR